MADADFDLVGKRVWVADNTGLVGSAVVRRLESEPIVITARSSEVDLIRQGETAPFVSGAMPDVAIIAAALGGGIHANRSAQARPCTTTS